MKSNPLTPHEQYRAYLQARTDEVKMHCKAASTALQQTKKLNQWPLQSLPWVCKPQAE